MNDTSSYSIAYDLADLYLDIAAIETRSNELVDLTDFAGLYDRANMPERVVVTSHGSELLAVDLFGSPSDGLWRLESTDGDTFRRVNGENTADDVVRFERDQTGVVTRYWRYYNYLLGGSRLANPSVGSVKMQEP